MSLADFSEKTDFAFSAARHEAPTPARNAAPAAINKEVDYDPSGKEGAASTSAGTEAGPTRIHKESTGSVDVDREFEKELDKDMSGIERVETKTSQDTAPVRTGPTRDGDEPTAEEKLTLRHISDRMPWSVWLVALVELSERLTYYGLTGPFQNYIQNQRTSHPGNPKLLPGALGRGQVTATTLSSFFQFWCYVTPILGAIIADSYLGRYKTICGAVSIYMTGILILLLTSLPSSLAHGAGFPGLISAMVIIGIGAGGIKSNVSPLIAEQYTEKLMRVKTNKKGERVILDPNATIQRIYNIFYWCINVGSLVGGTVTPYLEKYVDFWAAFLLPFCLFWLAVAGLAIGRKRYITREPSGSIIPRAFKALWIGARNKFNMDAAKPSWQLSKNGSSSVPWDDLFVEELKRVLIACRVFIAYPVFWVCYNQMSNNLVSQAGTMVQNGIPNDVLQSFNALSIIILIPICEKFLYPGLRRIKIPFRPISRITFGFILAAIAMAYAAILQNVIYKTGPCYDHPLTGKCAKNTTPNNVNVLWQIPVYVITGFAEIFASITGLEYAYTKAPVGMKSVVMSFFLLTTAGGALLGMAIAPVFKNPKMVIAYSSLGVVMFVTALIFWFCFRRYNAVEEKLNELDVLNDTPMIAVADGHTVDVGSTPGVTAAVAARKEESRA